MIDVRKDNLFVNTSTKVVRYLVVMVPSEECFSLYTGIPRIPMSRGIHQVHSSVILFQQVKLRFVSTMVEDNSETRHCITYKSLFLNDFGNTFQSKSLVTIATAKYFN